MDREKIKNFYAHEVEKIRLETEEFYLEGVRTKEIITRHMSKERMVIADIGGGAGFYAFWLQAMGHYVTLIDLSPTNIALAHHGHRPEGIALRAIIQLALTPLSGSFFFSI